MDEDLPVIMKLRMLCIHGCDHNWKLSWHMGSACFWTAKQYT